MDEFKRDFENRNSDESLNRDMQGEASGEPEHTAKVEMNDTPSIQENTPSRAQAKIEFQQEGSEPEETAERSETSYTYSGSALGDNAREVFEQSDNKTDGGYQSSPYSSQAYNNGYNYVHSNQNARSGLYNEHISSKPEKKEKKRLRYVAAMLAAAVLNLAVLGGAFALGHSFGSAGDESNKTTLSQQLKTDTSSGNTEGAANTVSTGDTMDTTQIAKNVGPAVVGIKSAVTGQYSLFGGYTTSEAQGSGIILSADGYIVTNNHVVENASSVTVQLNTGSEYTAEIIGTDEQTDLAVIKITPQEELTVAVLGDSTQVEVGETAIAIGNPMGLEFFGSVTQGIVSAVNRTVTVDNRTMNLIQTDAAINSGNSGGALINSKGEVIGINTVKVSTSGVEGMGFAIPISDAKPIISDLLEYGYVKGRPVIGVSTRDITEYMTMQYGWPQGAQIMSVTSENARNAGLQQGDIIVKIDGQEVKSGSDLTEYKDTKSPGDTVSLEVYKYATGSTETVSVVLSEQTPE